MQDFTRYRDNPVLYAEEILGVKTTPFQQRVMQEGADKLQALVDNYDEIDAPKSLNDDPVIGEPMPQDVLIGWGPYLRTMLNLVYSAICNPTTTTKIDMTTGKIIKE